MQHIQACRNGKGFAAWQFANTTGAARSYIIQFEGARNRSTTASAPGASVRGVSGRSAGIYVWVVKVAGVVIRSGAITFDCDTG